MLNGETKMAKKERAATSEREQPTTKEQFVVSQKQRQAAISRQEEAEAYLAFFKTVSTAEFAESRKEKMRRETPDEMLRRAEAERRAVAEHALRVEESKRQQACKTSEGECIFIVVRSSTAPFVAWVAGTYTTEKEASQNNWMVARRYPKHIVEVMTRDNFKRLRGYKRVDPPMQK